PTSKINSTNVLLRAISDAFDGSGDGFLMNRIANLGGAEIDLEGAVYIDTQTRRRTAKRGQVDKGMILMLSSSSAQCQSATSSKNMIHSTQRQEMPLVLSTKLQLGSSQT
ncbi:hypothetical protein U1Q18_030972, partial [Sarracenia purpurea var. burkii]